METTALEFRLRAKVDPEAAAEALRWYIEALRRNGQIVGSERPIARLRDRWIVFTSVPESGSLRVRHANQQVRLAATALSTAGFSAPKIRRIGSDPDERPACACRRRPFLILFTTFLEGGDPIRCGRCFDPIPMYALPTTGYAGDYQDIIWWQKTYQAIDWLWIGSGAGEQFAHDQLARHDSALSKDGRETARTLERRARRPVYYYLAKALARSLRRERARRCPSCGGRWLLQSPLHRIFDFRCDRCRLLSNIASDVRP